MKQERIWQKCSNKGVGAPAEASFKFRSVRWPAVGRLFPARQNLPERRDVARHSLDADTHQQSKFGVDQRAERGRIDRLAGKPPSCQVVGHGPGQHSVPDKLSLSRAEAVSAT